jgi:hypothetical protein
MAGRGPAPKDPRDRARRNPPRYPTLVIDGPPSPQPPLPATMPDGEPWPDRTRQWWAMWGRDPRSAEFREPDWSFLCDTAVLHGLFWRGESSAASELRLRVAKLGANPGDRAAASSVRSVKQEKWGRVRVQAGVKGGSGL